MIGYQASNGIVRCCGRKHRTKKAAERCLARKGLKLRYFWQVGRTGTGWMRLIRKEEL